MVSVPGEFDYLYDYISIGYLTRRHIAVKSDSKTSCVMPFPCQEKVEKRVS
jgi:hypothetical protein